MLGVMKSDETEGLLLQELLARVKLVLVSAYVGMYQFLHEAGSSCNYLRFPHLGLPSYVMKRRALKT